MTHQPANARLVTPIAALLLIVMTAGALAALIRYGIGLGATTNLSDQYPWGLWKGVNVMAAVALAAGGFTTAALVYLFGGQKYHVLARPAVLIGLLGYTSVGISLLVDLALPWQIWHPIIYWPEHSVLFEVSWCVMLYLCVLALEFTPVVLERFGFTGRLMGIWKRVAPLFSIAAIAFFVGIMSLSWNWALITLVFYAVLAAALRLAVPGRTEMPVMLIIAGVVFSTMHQSSLGSLFLLTRDKLDALWWTPMLPINFFLSAVAVGLAMVISIETLGAALFRRRPAREAVAGLGRLLAWALWIYLAVRLIDLVARGNLAGMLQSDKSSLFLLELGAGVVLPAAMLLSRRLRQNMGSLFVAALLVVVGVVFNRCNVAWLAMTMPGEATYYPSLVETAVTVSIVAAIAFFFALAAKLFPVFVAEEG